MKFTKKKVFISALAICLVAIISMGTLAWFSDSDSVENKFMITDSDQDDPEKIFSVDVLENTPETNNDQDGATYDAILPGDLLKKEAKVQNTGAYDQYVRVTITISDAEAWINALGAGYDVADLLVGFDSTLWVHGWNNMIDYQPGTALPENLIYVLYLKDILPATGADTVSIFDAVKIPETLTKEQAALFDGGFEIDIKAEAVQTENVGAENVAEVDKAWTAFKTVEADQNI